MPDLGAPRALRAQPRRRRCRRRGRRPTGEDEGHLTAGQEEIECSLVMIVPPSMNRV